MDRLNYVKIKEELPQIIEKVCNEHDPVIITTENNPPVVLMSLADYQSHEETLYLLKSPKNAQRLRDSIAELELGGIMERELLT
ncbi:MAG: type II toxin-antitoxin system prevent-host-death family antitoxin [Symploca sp. SIO1A3]|nr:type II toxin-antitoxin system prevent-host-death family antitoxin [Symploca sp. SIO1A3]